MDYYFFTPNRSRPPIFPQDPPVFYSPLPSKPFFPPHDVQILPPPPFGFNDSFSLQNELSNGFHHTPIKKKEFLFDYSRSKAKNNEKDTFAEEGLMDVVYYFKEILAFESEIEKTREELARRPDFRIIYVFNQLDQNNSKQILIPEMQLGLQNLGIAANSDDVYMLIKRYSLDQVEKLNLKEFETLFIPKSELNRREITRNEFSSLSYSLDKVLKTTKIYILKLFQLLLDFEHSLEFIRHKLVEKTVDLAKVFNLIDASKGCFLNSAEIKRIMSINGYSINDLETRIILMKFDRNQSGQIAFKEFATELNPRLQVFKKK